MQRAIKENTGDCTFVSEQEYNSVDDAVKGVNPLNEAEYRIDDLRINSTKYKLKNEDLHKANTEAFGKTNEPNRQNEADSSTTTNNITNS